MIFAFGRSVYKAFAMFANVIAVDEVSGVVYVTDVKVMEKTQ